MFENELGDWRGRGTAATITTKLPCLFTATVLCESVPLNFMNIHCKIMAN